MKISQQDYQRILQSELRDPATEQRRQDTLARSARLSAKLSGRDLGQGVVIDLNELRG